MGHRSILGDQVPGAEGAHEDRLVRPFGGQAEVVGEACGHAQVHISGGGFATQEVGFHLQVAVAEQKDVPAMGLGAAQVVGAERRRHGPVGVGAFAGLTTELIERLAGIPAMQLGKLLRHGRGLAGGVLIGEHAPFHQAGQAAGQGVDVDSESSA